MRKHSLNTRSINDNKGLKKSSEIENAVRRFKKREREQEKVLPLLGKKASAAMAAAFLRSLSNRRRPLYLSRRIQRARLSSRRRFFTEADISRAVHDTSFCLRRMRRGEGRGR